MDPCSSKDPWCPYCERSHEGPCLIGTPQKQQQSVVPAQVVVPPETPKKAKNFTCEECGKLFESRGKMTQHRMSHSGEKKYSCEYCGKGFGSKFKLVRHMVVHSKIREWECEACGTGFRRKDHLEAHLRQHCGVRTVYPCHLCTKTYSCKGSLRKHLALHSAQSGELKCQLCQYIAADNEAIMQHIRSHTGSRIMFWLYPEYIWQKFRPKTLRSSTPKCSVFPSFSSVNPDSQCEANARLSKAAADKKYRCSDCDRSFFTRKDAERHSVVHTRSRDFLCQFCPRTFGRSDHLSRHIEKSHGSQESGAGSSGSSHQVKSNLDVPSSSSYVLPGFSQAFRDV